MSPSHKSPRCDVCPLAAISPE
ncbi:MAG: hypothetical protein GX601_00570 [Anaerolineales bacterium]|nr:hypothetical protein [Anaerolineales bacterium]